MSPKPFDKIWDAHIVRAETPDTPATMYVDLHLVHEVTSPQAFAELEDRGLKVRRPDRTRDDRPFHPDPAVQGRHATAYATDAAAAQVETLYANTARHGIELNGWESEHRGVVHVIGPELGATQPGMTIVCGDSTRRRMVPSARWPSASARPRSATCWRRNACCSASPNPCVSTSPGVQAPTPRPRTSSSQ